MAKTTSKGLSLTEAINSAEEKTGFNFEQFEDGDLFEPFASPGKGIIQDSPGDESVESENNLVTEDAEDDDRPLSLADIALVEGDDQPSKESSEGEINWNATFNVPGLGTVSLRQLIDGNLRQADYTKKTQQLAEERRQLESEDTKSAMRLYEMLKEDTVGTIRQLAVEAGVLDGNVEPGQNRLPLPKQVSEEDIAKLVESKLQSLLGQNPELQEMQRQREVQRIESRFSEIQDYYGVELSDNDKLAILDQALRANEPDLELTFVRMKTALDRLNAEKERVRSASTKTVRTRAPERPVNEPAKTVAEAYQRALVALQE